MATSPQTWSAVLTCQAEAAQLDRAALPTMYDLPSENPEESGLPDEFHYYQPQLLRETFQPLHYPLERFFVASNLYLYYAVQQPTWYKNPDWFAVLDVDRFYEKHDLRLSYVMWQERVVPYLVVELLSPGTEREDMGKTECITAETPPTKWTVYEQIVQVPYYVVFDRYTNTVHFYVLTQGQYQEVTSANQRLWLPEAGLGIGLWFGTYQGLERLWLRFYGRRGECLPTPLEQTRQRVEQEYQGAEQERQRAERLAAQLRALGIDPVV